MNYYYYYYYRLQACTMCARARKILWTRCKEVSFQSLSLFFFSFVFFSISTFFVFRDFIFFLRWIWCESIYADGFYVYLLIFTVSKTTMI